MSNSERQGNEGGSIISIFDPSASLSILLNHPFNLGQPRIPMYSRDENLVLDANEEKQMYTRASNQERVKLFKEGSCSNGGIYWHLLQFLMQISVISDREESERESLTPQNKILKVLSDFCVVLGHLTKPQHLHPYAHWNVRDSRYSFVSKLAKPAAFCLLPEFLMLRCLPKLFSPFSWLSSAPLLTMKSGKVWNYLTTQVNLAYHSMIHTHQL